MPHTTSRRRYEAYRAQMRERFTRMRREGSVVSRQGTERSLKRSRNFGALLREFLGLLGPSRRSLAVALGGEKSIQALAADTDGIDGMEPVAGAVIGPDSLARARALGFDPAAVLANNDAHSLFEALGDQVVTGPTHTNVNDFRAILIR